MTAPTPRTAPARPAPAPPAAPPSGPSRIAARVPATTRVPLAVFAACQGLFAIWWLAFHPALLSYDSLTYVWHVTTGNWRSDHSVVYDACVWLSLQLTGGIGALTILQTTAMSAALAYCCHGLAGFGVRGRWSGAAAVTCAALPPTGTFTVFLWKDTAFAIAAVLAFGAVTHLAGRERSTVHWALLAVAMTGLAVFRNNGYPVVLVAAVILAVAMPRHWRRICAATLGPVALALSLTFGLYPALGVQPPRTSSYYAFNYADIAVAYHRSPRSISLADRAVMEKVAPLEHWSNGGWACGYVDPLLARPFDRRAAERHNDALLGVWKRAFTRRPDLVLSGHLCRSRIGWDALQSDSNVYISPVRMPEDLFGYAEPGGRLEGSPYLSALRSDPPSATLRHLAVFAYKAAKVPELVWLLWAGSLWCYVTYLTVLRFAWRHRLRRALALVAVTAGLQAAVLAATPANLFRYMAAPIFIGLLALTLLSALPGRGERVPAPGRPAAHGARAPVGPARGPAR